MGKISIKKLNGEVEEIELILGTSLKGRINPKVNRLLKKGGKIKFLPNDVAYDTITRKFIRTFNKERTVGNLEGIPFSTNSVNSKLKKLLRSRPKTIRLPNKQVVNLDSGKYEPIAEWFVGKSRLMKDSKKEQGWVNELQNKVVFQQQIPKGKLIDEEGFSTLFYTPKTQNSGASIFQQYNYFGESPPETTDEFLDMIVGAFDSDFSSADKSRPNVKVVLKFGATDFRLFPLDVLMNEGVSFAIDDFANQETSGWGGSDAQGIDGESLVSLGNLDMTFFRIILTGSPSAGAKDDSGIKSRWFFLDQIKTNKNECLEGALKRFLKMSERVHTIRVMMVELGMGIEMDMPITLEQLKIYEFQHQVNIEVYVDKPHIYKGEEEYNLIREGSKMFDKTMKLLILNNHYYLIKSPKKNIKDVSRTDLRLLGYDKDGNKSVIKLIEEANAKQEGKNIKDKKEMVVIFDNETIFDRLDDNFLKVYGVAWFVWDINTPFDYNSGWNADKTDNKYHYEPYCYYEKGENCLDKFIKFLLNPPVDIIYRPMGFNNSRFDNYSFCESAMKFQVLEDVFMADGSILYARINGIKNVWDASRFLVGQSLNNACKNYGTNPKKQPDLINHYEVQCWYENNGWEGLNKLLDDKPELVLYNKIDCICLLDLIQKMRSAYLELFREDVLENLTISSMGFNILKKKWDGKQDYIIKRIKEMGYNNLDEMSKNDKKELQEEIKTLKPKHNIIKAKTFKDDLFMRRSMVGGRTQSFYGKLDIKMPIAMCDVKSLYPTVMGSYGKNDCPFPYGMYKETKGYVRNKLGIYRVDIIHQRCKWKNSSPIMSAFNRVKCEVGKDLHRIYAPCVIARRTKDNPLDWFYRGKQESIYLTSVDIDVLRWATEDDNCVKIYEGFYWGETKKDIFTDFLEPAKQEKTNQDILKSKDSPLYNQAKREGCKMLSNSVSGKLLEEIHEDVGSLFTTKNYCKMESDEGIYQLDIHNFGCGFAYLTGKKRASVVFDAMKDDKKKPAYLGMFVYAYARKLMYQELLSKYLVLYMDTDSACMPLFEWERCCQENKDNGLIDTGEYGCLEEEVCYTDKATGKFYPANRLIGISPKNYLVLNDEKDFMSKRKFKGVRKTDYWLPLSYFGEYELDEKNKAFGRAVDMIRGNKKEGCPPMTQDDIRRMREFNCCIDCINDKMNTKEICEKCIKQSKLMKKSYSTEMFEELVNGRKIVVFCSMINRIKYQVGSETSSEYMEELGNCLSVEEMEKMVLNGNDSPMSFSITHRNYDLWQKKKKEFKKLHPNLPPKDLADEFISFFQRFRKIKHEREIKNCFKLKQTYMMKII